MTYLRTRQATDFEAPSNSWQRLLDIDTANPTYRGKYHLVRSWLVAFDDQGEPWREIALDEDGAVLMAGPSDVDYGFWLDTNIRFPDFTGELIAHEYFEQMWVASGVSAPGAA